MAGLFKSRKEALKAKTEYETLKGIVHEIAEGNADVNVPASLGAYQDLREDIVKIQEGVNEAVLERMKSERMKMELVSNVSHDVKTPLTAMITYIDLLKDEKLSKDKQEEYLNIISVRAERLKHLIEDLFEVTKASTGNIKFEPLKMDIVNLVKQVVNEFDDKLLENNLEVVFDLPDYKIPVFADSQKTYRIYANLIGNAAKYSMINSRVYVQVTDSDDEVCVVIKNSSASKITVSPSELSERFVRGDSSRHTEGSGLGLSIAKSFTELQGGTLDIIIDGDLFKVITVWKKMKAENVENKNEPC